MKGSYLVSERTNPSSTHDILVLTAPTSTMQAVDKPAPKHAE